MRGKKRKLLIVAFCMMFMQMLMGSAIHCEAAETGKYFTSGKLYYHTITKNKVEVCGTKQTTGTLTIPASVTYNGKKYKVTKIADYELYTQDNTSDVNGKETNIYNGEKCYYRYTRVDGKGMPANIEWIAGSGIKKVVLPNTLTYIGNGAFNGCSKLKSVTFAKSYKKLTIGENVFGGTKIKSLVFPKGTYELKDSVAGNVPAITIPASVKKIGAGVVNYKTKKVTISKKNKKFKMKDGILYSADEKTLYGASSKAKKKIAISQKTTRIMDKAFYKSKASVITLNNKITVIPKGAFCGSAQLVRVEKTDNVTLIMRGAFAGCTKLQEIGTMPKLGKIEGAAFWQDSQLSLDIADTVKDVSDYAFSGTVTKTQLKSVNIAPGNKLLSISDGLLVKSSDSGKIVIMQIADAEKLVVSEGITEVAVCLGGTGCKEIKLPPTLMVQNGRFRLNSGNVIFTGTTVPEFGKDFDMSGVETVYVPKNTLEQYRKAMESVVKERDDVKLFDEDFGPYIKEY